MLTRRTASSLCIAVCSTGMGACAGGGPLLHGVHALPDGQVQAGAGLSANVTNGALRHVIDGASAEGARDRASGAAAERAIAPGMAPWVALRAGLGAETEVGLGYTGRAVRLDGRHVFEHGSLGLSLGAGASMLLDDRDERSGGARWSLARSSIGLDLPVLLGWRSAADIVTVYGGPRLGWERVAGELSFDAGDQAGATGVTLRHLSVGGVAGVTLGFRHVHGALELQTTYHRVEGNVDASEVRARGVTLTPAAGLLFTF